MKNSWAPLQGHARCLSRTVPLRKKEIIDETLKNDENETINRAEVVWGYDGSEIPAHDWPSHFPCGCGPNQSPININLRNVKYSEDLAPLKINYSITPHYLINDGHAIRVHYQPGSTIEGNRFVIFDSQSDFEIHFGSKIMIQ